MFATKIYRSYMLLRITLTEPFSYEILCRKSAVNVIDAKTMSMEPVAVVELPKRVPYGFHAFFVTEEQIREQAKL
ncbi:hypothetical protein MTR67_004207 [Solanum verrucosum]|uniref:Uncharacterized protein n=1 Tax=Solanum verrucosum TaxID=315347 RepID=A0AAF0T7K2_SOLVR|nr:hypothetical protein MTR67_004207 [Solanum verrucosum]